LSADPAGLPDHAIVTDIVYVPLETPLLAAARGRGLWTVDGLGMLLHQAVPGFERWFGTRPEVTAELRRMIIADIEAH
ncbi:MAG: shikimate dehydrogenase, partial [Mesorhizobium sp.]